MKQFLFVIVITWLAVGGCASFKRNAIKGEIHDALSDLNAKPNTELVKLTDGVYTYKWYSYRTGFVTTPGGVVVFDPLNATAAGELRREIERVAPNHEIKYVIYSHAHADHISGVKALGGNPIIIAHKNVLRDITARPLPDITAPNETFEGDTKELTVGGVTFQLIWLPGAHTDGMTATYVPQRKTLVEVDMAHVKMMTPVGAPFSSWHGQLAAIEAMLKLDFQFVIPGHGPAGTKQDIADYLAMLHDMERTLRTAASAHGVTQFHGDPAFFTHPKLGDIMFDALDALHGKYKDWQGWEHHTLQALQWAFLYGILMNE